MHQRPGRMLRLRMLNYLKEHLDKRISLKYSIPDINLDHIKKLTTDFGIIQFSKINKPDILSGYTVDDNARALIAFCQHYELTADESDLDFIRKYFRFIQFCQQPGGNFLNYVDDQFHFTPQNDIENLEDSNGRVIMGAGLPYFNGEPASRRYKQRSHQYYEKVPSKCTADSFNEGHGVHN